MAKRYAPLPIERQMRLLSLHPKVSCRKKYHFGDGRETNGNHMWSMIRACWYHIMDKSCMENGDIEMPFAFCPSLPPHTHEIFHCRLMKIVQECNHSKKEYQMDSINVLWNLQSPHQILIETRNK